MEKHIKEFEALLDSLENIDEITIEQLEIMIDVADGLKKVCEGHIKLKEVRQVLVDASLEDDDDSADDTYY